MSSEYIMAKELVDKLKAKQQIIGEKKFDKNNSEYQPELSKLCNMYDENPNIWNLTINFRYKKNKNEYPVEYFMKSTLELHKQKKMSCSKDALENENRCMNRFNNDNIYRKYVLNMLGIYYDEIDNEIDNDKYNDYICEKPKDIKETTEWTNLKKGTKGKKTTPKTDVIIKNKNNNYMINISIKSGKGRITSGDAFETNALFRSVLNNSKKYTDNIELKKLIDELFNTMSGKRYTVNDKNITFTRLTQISEGKIIDISDEEKNSSEWYCGKIQEYEKCNKIWKNLRENHRDYCIDIIKEGLQGKYKFADNIGTADILLTLNGCTTDVVSILHFADELVFDEHVNNLFDNNSELKGNVFRTKTTSDKKGIRQFWTRFL